MKQGSEQPTETVIPDDQRAALKERHKNISLTVRRSMLLLLAYSTFCVVTVAQTDEPFILSGVGITLPIVNVSVNPNAFLIAGPLGLLAIAIYLHIFLEKLHRMGSLPEEDRMPFLFNFDDGFSRALSWLIFYGMPPAIIAAFAWKAAVLPENELALDAAVAVTVTTIGLMYWRARRRWGSLQMGAVTVALGLTILAIHWSPTQWLKRSLNLERAQLSEAYLLNADLRGVDLHFANLRAANLRAADLRGAYLSRANLRGAFLQGANLSGANLSGADLGNAILTEANLIEANLSRAYLARANLGKAILSGANLTGVRRLTQGQLDNACIAKDGDPPTLPEGLNPPTNVCPED